MVVETATATKFPVEKEKMPHNEGQEQLDAYFHQPIKVEPTKKSCSAKRCVMVFLIIVVLSLLGVAAYYSFRTFRIQMKHHEDHEERMPGFVEMLKGDDVTKHGSKFGKHIAGLTMGIRHHLSNMKGMEDEHENKFPGHRPLDHKSNLAVKPHHFGNAIGGKKGVRPRPHHRRPHQKKNRPKIRGNRHNKPSQLLNKIRNKLKKRRPRPSA